MVTNQQAGRFFSRQILVLVLALPLIACGDSDISVPKNQLTVSKFQQDGEKKTVRDSFNAALGPLEDMGLRKREIPQQLKLLAKNPYVMPGTLACDDIKSEIATLDEILGKDTSGKPKTALSATEQATEVGGDMLHDTVVGFVRSQTSIVPLRSIVRKVTGAEKHEKRVKKAAEAGKLRRAYLRGLADAKFGDKCMTGPIVVGAAKEDTEVVSQFLEVKKK